MSNNDKLESMIVKIDDRLDNVEQTLLRNTLSLEEHVRRTDLIETYVKERDIAVKADLDPIKDHVNQIKSSIKGILFFCTVIASVAGFVLILKQLNLI